MDDEAAYEQNLEAILKAHAQQVQEATDKNQVLEQQLAQIQTTLKDEADDLRRQLHDSLAEIDRLNAEHHTVVDDMQHQINGLQRLVQDIPDEPVIPAPLPAKPDTTELDTLRHELARLEKEVATLNGHLEYYKKHSATQQKTIDELRQYIASTKNALQAAVTQNARRFQQLRENVAQGVQRQIKLGELTELLPNVTKHTRYASKHVREFIEFFKLESNDLASTRNEVESSDDDDPLDAPPAAASRLEEEEASESDSDSAPAFKNAYIAAEHSILSDLTQHPEPPDTHVREDEIDPDDAGLTDPASPATAGAGA